MLHRLIYHGTAGWRSVPPLRVAPRREDHPSPILEVSSRLEAVQPFLIFGAPARLVSLEPHDPRLDLEGQLLGVAFSPAQASASHGELPAGTLTRYLPRFDAGPRLVPPQASGPSAQMDRGKTNPHQGRSSG